MIMNGHLGYPPRRPSLWIAVSLTLWIENGARRESCLPLLLIIGVLLLVRVVVRSGL